jgi:tRNA-guanine family transglycosylase
MSFRFEIEATDGKARAGRFFTPHGEVQTPVFMPVGSSEPAVPVKSKTVEEVQVGLTTMAKKETSLFVAGSRCNVKTRD